MPTIPDATALGSRPTPQPQSGIYSYQSGREAASAFEGAQALGKVAGAVDQYVGERHDADVKLQTAYARSALLQAHTNTLIELEKSPDYPNYESAYKAKMAESMTTARQMIKSGMGQEDFGIWANDLVGGHGIPKVKDLAWGKEVDHGKSELIKMEAADIDAILRSPDPAIGEAIEDELHKSIVASFEKGYLDESEATKKHLNVAEQIAVARLNQYSPQERQKILSGQTRLPTTADDAIGFLIRNTEGTGLVPQDGKRGASKFGINQTANPDVDVANLTQEQAARLYKERYWDAIDADNLPEAMRYAAFDTAVNFGVPAAKKMLGEANGDPRRLLQLRQDKYTALVRKDHEAYGQYADGWRSRNALIETGITTRRFANIPAEKAAILMEKAEAESIRMAEYMDRVREKQEKALGEAAAKEGDRLKAEGGLSKEWIEENREILSQSDYRYFQKSVSGDENNITEPRTYMDLKERAGRGEDVRDDAKVAYGSGLLERGSYDAIVGVVEKGEIKAPWFQRGNDFIQSSLKPSDVNPDPAAPQRYAQAADEWHRWAANNPAALAADAEAEYRSIVRRNSIADFRETALMLPLPRYAVGDRNAMDVGAAARAMRDAFDRGDISAGEYEREKELLVKWKRAQDKLNTVIGEKK